MNIKSHDCDCHRFKKILHNGKEPRYLKKIDRIGARFNTQKYERCIREKHAAIKQTRIAKLGEL